MYFVPQFQPRRFLEPTPASRLDYPFADQESPGAPLPLRPKATFPANHENQPARVEVPDAQVRIVRTGPAQSTVGG